MNVIIAWGLRYLTSQIMTDFPFMCLFQYRRSPSSPHTFARSSPRSSEILFHHLPHPSPRRLFFTCLFSSGSTSLFLPIFFSHPYWKARTQGQILDALSHQRCLCSSVIRSWRACQRWTVERTPTHTHSRTRAHIFIKKKHTHMHTQCPEISIEDIKGLWEGRRKGWVSPCWVDTWIGNTWDGKMGSWRAQRVCVCVCVL